MSLELGPLATILTAMLPSKCEGGKLIDLVGAYLLYLHHGFIHQKAFQYRAIEMAFARECTLWTYWYSSRQGHVRTEKAIFALASSNKGKDWI